MRNSVNDGPCVATKVLYCSDLKAAYSRIEAAKELFLGVSLFIGGAFEDPDDSLDTSVVLLPNTLACVVRVEESHTVFKALVWSEEDEQIWALSDTEGSTIAVAVYPSMLGIRTAEEDKWMERIGDEYPNAIP